MDAEPFCRLIEFALSHICHAIELGDISLTDSYKKARGHYFTIINSLPIVCQTYHAEAHRLEGFEFILFYERVRTGVGARFMLEGLPAGVNISAGATGKPVDSEDVVKVTPNDIPTNRANLVKMLENMTNTQAYKKELCRQHRLADVPNDVPAPVHVLVSNARGIYSALRRSRPGRAFHACENELCGRVFFRGDGLEMRRWCDNTPAHNGEAAVKELRTRLGLGTDQSALYWSKVCGGQLSVDRPRARFCSTACFAQHKRHLEEQLPDGTVNLNADDDVQGASGRRRVALAFKAGLKRNEKAARFLRTAGKRPRASLAVSPFEVAQHRARRVCALNVDLALLYAASVLAESAIASKNMVLPGSEAEWRADEAFWAKGLGAVMKMYWKNKTESVVTSVLTSPKFMDEIKTKAHALF